MKYSLNMNFEEKFIRYVGGNKNISMMVISRFFRSDIFNWFLANIRNFRRKGI